MVGVNGTEVCTSWSKTEILKAQQDNPSISMIMQKLSCSDDLPEEGNDHDNSKDNGERRRYRQLWSQLEMVDGVLHSCVDKGTPSKRLVLVVPRKMRADLLNFLMMTHVPDTSGYKPLLRTSATTLLLAGNGSRIAECEKCNRRKTPVPSQKAPMQSIEIGQPMELWAMDVLGPLPMTAQGNQYVLVMSDHFTKWVEAVPMLLNQRAETVAKAFVNEVVTRHGVPSKLLTGQGRNFEADLMKQVFGLPGVRKLRTSPYHPQTDGQVERMNRTLKGILTAYVNKDHNDWDDHLPLALFAYRNSVHSSSGVSPFKTIYGREATIHRSYL